MDLLFKYDFRFSTHDDPVLSCLCVGGLWLFQGEFSGRQVVVPNCTGYLYDSAKQSILVPQFIMYRMLGLFDTRIGLVLLTSFSVLGVFMLRQFFIAIHNDYIESAKIDGANHFTIFMQIAFPLIKPAVATYAILRFIWTWNDYQNPLIFLRTDSLLTLQVALQKFTSISGEYYSLIMAGAVSGIVPLLIVFIIGQKSVIEGITMGGIKG
ncbi:carbohydrate ABC transporter permease [Paenibacillus sp. P25]|nr:carbohydrate ABC transporter permease [Paenibacillus sp. P25]